MPSFSSTTVSNVHGGRYARLAPRRMFDAIAPAAAFAHVLLDSARTIAHWPGFARSSLAIAAWSRRSCVPGPPGSIVGVAHSMLLLAIVASLSFVRVIRVRFAYERNAYARTMRITRVRKTS